MDEYHDICMHCYDVINTIMWVLEKLKNQNIMGGDMSCDVMSYPPITEGIGVW